MDCFPAKIKMKWDIIYTLHYWCTLNNVPQYNESLGILCLKSEKIISSFNYKIAIKSINLQFKEMIFG